MSNRLEFTTLLRKDDHITMQYLKKRGCELLWIMENEGTMYHTYQVRLPEGSQRINNGNHHWYTFHNGNYLFTIQTSASHEQTIITIPIIPSDPRPSLLEVRMFYRISLQTLAQTAHISFDVAQKIESSGEGESHHIEALLNALSTLTRQTYTSQEIGHFVFLTPSANILRHLV